MSDKPGKKSSKKDKKSRKPEEEEEDGERDEGDRDKKKKKKKKKDKKSRKNKEDNDESGSEDGSEDGDNIGKDKKKKKSRKKDKKDKKSKKDSPDLEEGGAPKGDEEDEKDQKKKKKKKNKGDKDKKGKNKKKKKKKKKQKGKDGKDGEESDEESNKKKLETNVTLVTDTKVTFEELQRRRAENLKRCQLAMIVALALGLLFLIIGSGLVTAFTYVGRCADPIYNYSCAIYECCSINCETVNETQCIQVIASPLETSGLVLMVLGFSALLADIICFAQVQRNAQFDVPATLFGTCFVAAVVMLFIAILAFTIAALAATGYVDTTTEVDDVEQSFMVVGITFVWPVVPMMLVSIIVLYVRWRSQNTSRRHRVLVLGLSGSGKSHAVSQLVQTAEVQFGSKSSGTLHNPGGLPTNGIFVQGVSRADGHALLFVEMGDIDINQTLYVF